jgi:hypothetical protein
MATSFQEIIAEFKSIIRHLEESDIDSEQTDDPLQSAVVILITREGTSIRTFGEIATHALVGHLENFKYDLFRGLTETSAKPAPEKETSPALN